MRPSNSAVVDAEFLAAQLNDSNWVVLNATIKKVGTSSEQQVHEQIPGAIFFDIKQRFSNTESALPNTVPLEEQFEQEVQKLGIDTTTNIVVYDELGIYSAPRAWWLFKAFGHQNVWVLDGGLKAWKAKGYALESKLENSVMSTGDFKARWNASAISTTAEMLSMINDEEHCILDARSADRFFARVPEPRADLRGGHIPSSQNVPFTEVLEGGFLKNEAALKAIFENYVAKNVLPVFTCGSGITACIIALAAYSIGIENFKIYDGSWTEWATTPELPIEK